MLDLIKYIVGQFAEDKENVEYVVEEKDRVIEVCVILSPSDMGKVIGKQGKIAKAMRTIVPRTSPRENTLRIDLTRWKSVVNFLVQIAPIHSISHARL